MGSQYLDVDRLCESINRDYTDLKPYRNERVEMARHADGDRYSQNAQDKAVYVNLTSLYTNIVSRNLISKNPRVMLSTESERDRPVVNAMQTWANEELERMNFSEVMRRVVIDAFYGMGICKVALATPADASTQSWSLKAGQPFVIPIDFGDVAFDLNARNFQEISYFAHRYRAVKRDIT